MSIKDVLFGKKYRSIKIDSNGRASVDSKKFFSAITQDCIAATARRCAEIASEHLEHEEYEHCTRHGCVREIVEAIRREYPE